MTNQFTAENPDEIRFTVTLTYSIKSWRMIADSLSQNPLRSYEVDQLRRNILDCVRQAEKVYYPESEK